MYEELGLLGKVQRLGAYRIYTESHLVQVKLIRQAQTLGFKLVELKNVLMNDEHEPDWYRVMQEIKNKRTRLSEEIARMQALDAALIDSLAQ